MTGLEWSDEPMQPYETNLYKLHLENIMKKIHWLPCQKCGERPHHLYEWCGEQICYKCMKDMGLIGL